VNEHTFVKAVEGRNEAAAAEILGNPSRKGEGEVVRYERGEGEDLVQPTS
jgi:hypothetical protein